MFFNLERDLKYVAGVFILFDIWFTINFISWYNSNNIFVFNKLNCFFKEKR